MNRSVFFALFSLCLFFSCENPSKLDKEHNIDTKDWMADVFGENQNLKLNDIAIPGTYYSLTYQITPDSPYATDSISEWTLSVQKEVGREVLAAFSMNQNLDVKEQLRQGIRYFDFRLESYESTIFSFHNFLSSEIEPVLDEFSHFAANHPKEIVFIDLKKVNVEPPLYGELLQLIIDRLGRHIVQVSDINPDSTVKNLWNKGVSVVLLSSYPPQTLRQEKMIFNRDNWFTEVIPTYQTTDSIFNALTTSLKTKDSVRMAILGIVQHPSALTLLSSVSGSPQSIYEMCTQKDSPNAMFKNWFINLDTQIKKNGNIFLFNQFQTNPENITEIIKYNKNL
ncbi:MAG: hypothetical protein ACEPOW_04570 [Bacteroidales bacterium]